MDKEYRVSTDALNYALGQLACRAGAPDGFEQLSIPFFYGYPDNYTAGVPAIIIVPITSASWRRVLALPNNTLDWLPQDRVLLPSGQLPFLDTIPVLFWGAGYEDGHKPFAERAPNGSVVFYADIIAATLFMLSRWEETIVLDRDEHGRFPATASVAYKQGFLDRPIIDEYALILREWIKVLLPRWEPEANTFSVKLTHDVDSLRNFVSLSIGLRILAGDMLKRKDMRKAKQTLADLTQQLTNPISMDSLEGLNLLTAISEEAEFRNDAFYIMATGAGLQQSDYDFRSPLLREAIDRLRSRGFELGIHPGYTTLNDPEQLALEKSRVDALLGEQNYGGRQHYLRFKVPDTWYHWASLGLTYDSSLGYPKYTGFRCGTCHPFQPFDTSSDTMINIWEYPLIVMDGTLKVHRQLTPQQGEQHIMKLAHRCRAVEGNFVMLWHNSSLHREWQPWGRMYAHVVHKLAELCRG